MWSNSEDILIQIASKYESENKKILKSYNLPSGSNSFSAVVICANNQDRGVLRDAFFFYCLARGLDSRKIFKHLKFIVNKTDAIGLRIQTIYYSKKWLDQAYTNISPAYIRHRALASGCKDYIEILGELSWYERPNW